MTPTCPTCHRSDCGLLADVIVGRLAYLRAVAECFRAARGKRS